MENLNAETLRYIIARLLENAKEAVEESRADREDEYKAGRNLAYYEMLDILKSELDIADAELKEFGLDVDLEREYL